MKNTENRKCLDGSLRMRTKARTREGTRMRMYVLHSTTVEEVPRIGMNVLREKEYRTYFKEKAPG